MTTTGTVSRHPSPATPIVTVCMICRREYDRRHTPCGPALSKATGQSHGICRECAPSYFRTMGLTDDQAAHIIHTAD